MSDMTTAQGALQNLGPFTGYVKRALQSSMPTGIPLTWGEAYGMRWTKDGPDIPVELVQSVEEGRVVFFCGAGVSQQSGLPSFQGLVEKVYGKLHRNRESFPAEATAFRDEDYDQVFAALEAAIREPGLIRRLVADSLALAGDADTSTDRALLNLATDRNGKCRLVTTNYDRCFLPHLAAGVRIDPAPRGIIP